MTPLLVNDDSSEPLALPAKPVPAGDWPDVAHRWLPGYFTPLLHAVAESPARPLVFHGLSIRWAVCGAPAAAVDVPDGRNRCPCCEAELWSRTLRR